MKKIAVIFGGTSSEKEVSLHTGLAVIEAIKNIYDVTAINLEGDFHDLHSLKIVHLFTFSWKYKSFRVCL